MEKKAVRFTQSRGVYNAGDVAVFNVPVSDQLIRESAAVAFEPNTGPFKPLDTTVGEKTEIAPRIEKVITPKPKVALRSREAK